MHHRILKIVLALTLALALGVTDASAQPKLAKLAPAESSLVTGYDARARIAEEEPEAEVRWCQRKAVNHIRCWVNVFIITQGELIDEATGAVIEAAHPVSVTPVPMWVDAWPRGNSWTLP